jgi:5-methylcytosine-specific restriction protein A
VFCPGAGCTTIVPAGQRCTLHPRPDLRPNATQRGYGSIDWRATRKRILLRDPLCVIGGCVEKSKAADHFPLERKQLLAMGVPDPDADHRLRGLCIRHHNQRSGRMTANRR